MQESENTAVQLQEWGYGCDQSVRSKMVREDTPDDGLSEQEARTVSVHRRGEGSGGVGVGEGAERREREKADAGHRRQSSHGAHRGRVGRAGKRASGVAGPTATGWRG